MARGSGGRCRLELPRRPVMASCSLTVSLEYEVARPQGLATDAYVVRVLDAMHYAAQPAIRQHDGAKLVGENFPYDFNGDRP